MEDPAIRALTLRHLQFFSVLVQEGHFGRAAQRLSITQPALSNAIKQMEKLLGAQLLTRNTHRLEITPLGTEVLARTDFLVNTVDLALQDIQQVVQRGRSLVRVGVIPSASTRVAMAAAAFQPAGAPQVEFTWRDAPSTVLLQEVREGRLDLALAAITQPPDGLTCIDLFHDPLVLVVPADHALARAGKASWKSIGHERLVLFESGSMPALGEPARAQFGLSAQAAYRVQYSETLYALVRGGLALGLMPHLYTTALHDPALAVLELQEPRIERRVVLVYRQGPMRNAVAREFIDFLREYLTSSTKLNVRRMTRSSRQGKAGATRNR
ncbi:LysR family transcriptional regulator [Hydrogenophaga sp. BPS33]|uniref:LysR family transcriptional regulator n=1 Tax=Hydrogenophaga sp. BPS33 TaxID=2651974 RepID=UPI00131F887E|nr:LysR family transcriptional regulator [Hydrogenophaga sp. BPS33]QHE86889.1 LysR family transcriptional regulator [Hydrogenophaga sp. BPS33]